MPFGGGLIWDRGDDPGQENSSVNVEVTVKGSQIRGMVRIKIGDRDSGVSLAAKVTDEWNKRRPIETLFAFTDENSPMTVFLPQIGANRKPINPIIGMAATFDGRARVELARNAKIKDSASGVTLQRVDISVQPTIQKSQPVNVTQPQSQTAPGVPSA